MTGPCEHQLDRLEVDAGPAGVRGQGQPFAVKCHACQNKFTGPAGMRLLVDSMARDSAALWTAVVALGGKRQAPPAALHAVPAAECAHYLSWLRPEGFEARRGAEGTLTFRCSGCRAGWPMAVGLGMYLERMIGDREALRAAVRKLGGVI